MAAGAFRIRCGHGLLAVLLAVAVAAGGALAGAAGTARAGESAAPVRTVKVSWQIVAEDRSIGEGCSVTAFLQVTAVPGAISYAVTIVDSLTGTYNLSGPPFPGDKVDVVGQIVRAPAGKHRWGLSSYGENTRGEGCALAKAGFLSGKRWKVTSATATVAGKAKPEDEKGSISGRVVETECADSGHGCTIKGLPGVTITASGGPGGTATTSTRDKGNYSLKVDKGRWTVTPSLGERVFDPPSGSVTVNGDEADVSFKTCAIGRETQSARARAKATATSCDKLLIDWTMPDHVLAAGWNDEEPSRAYINPKDGWQIDLFLKKPSGAPMSCTPGHSYTWHIAPRGTKDTKVLATRSCKVKTTVPREGVYSVKVEERQTRPDKLIAKGAKDVVVQDFLLVGLGDSNGSGQANPPYWNKQCDRSEYSYQMRTARFVENEDRRTSVTFVHLACSGARTVHIADRPYVGQEPGKGHGPVQPQLLALKQAMSQGKPVREIDAMIMSIGINDLRFGGILGVCLGNAGARPLTQGGIPCQDVPVVRAPDKHGEPTLEPAPPGSQGDGTLRQAVNEEIRQLPERYAKLKEGIARRVTVKPERIIATTYPDESWREKGVLCDEKSGYVPRLLSTEWAWLSEAGGELNKAVAAAFTTSVTTIPELFIGHGYCTPVGQNWFRSVLKSLRSQFNEFGTFHPTLEGHFKMMSAVVDVLCPQLYPGERTKFCKGMAREPGKV